MAARNDRFFNAANVEDRTDVVDNRYGGYQSIRQRAGDYIAFVECWGGRVDCGGQCHLEIHNDVHNTDFCYIIEWYIAVLGSLAEC